MNTLPGCLYVRFILFCIRDALILEILKDAHELVIGSAAEFTADDGIA